MSDAGDTSLTVVCPHCGGPLHLEPAEDAAECVRGHRFSVAQVVLDQTRLTARATWKAVSSLEERAQVSRWAAADPELYQMGSAEQLERSAAEDEELAATLRRQAQSLDRTVDALAGAAGPDMTSTSSAEGSP